MLLATYTTFEVQVHYESTSEESILDLSNLIL